MQELTNRVRKWKDNYGCTPTDNEDTQKQSVYKISNNRCFINWTKLGNTEVQRDQNIIKQSVYKNFN